MNNDAQRKAFETFTEDWNVRLGRDVFGYTDERAIVAWAAWQESRKQALEEAYRAYETAMGYGASDRAIETILRGLKDS